MQTSDKPKHFLVHYPLRSCLDGNLVKSCIFSFHLFAMSEYQYAEMNDFPRFVSPGYILRKMVQGCELIYIILLKSVAILKLQVVKCSRSSREVSQSVRIDWKHFLSRVRVSVWPSNFLYAKKTPRNYREDRVSVKCLLNEQTSDPMKWGR